ncbi:MAG TPA: hypothetical protein ENK44_03275 [Caldithrix abyssi]|uniref:Uncharacterized protein n=1 Tax=Caldithrix abyssi TaxID=187145 RepID=A0A7V4TYE9_CALAY|nr:hypothetical protein [Caldithrix abyssi]
MKVKLLFIVLLIFWEYAFSSIHLSKIEGWKTLDKPLSYNPQTLWEYIDGAADLFLSYGFEHLISQELEQDSIIVVLDIYDMGKPLNAFGIYSAERPSKAGRWSAGAEAVIIPPYQALMVKGQYYVKVNVSRGNLETEAAYALMQKVAQILPGTNNYPQEFTILPGKNRQPYSYSYTKENFSGLSELNSCISAEYQSGDYGSYTCFAVVGLEQEEMQSIWTTITSKWKKDTFAKTEVYYRKIPYKGYVGVIKKNGTILGITGIKDKTHLFEMLEQLK